MDRELIAIAKHWGLANGFTSHGGGWVKKANGRLVCQGWTKFAKRYRRQILAAGRPATGRRIQAGFDDLKSWHAPTLPEQLEGLER
jgi:hypothetical protein